MKSLIRFIIVGASVALIYVLLCNWALGQFLSFPKALVTFGCYCVLILPTYFLHHSFSFQSDAGHKTALPRYVMVQILGMILTFVFSVLAFNWLHLPNLLGSAMITILTSGTSFVILRLWTFKAK